MCLLTAGIAVPSTNAQEGQSIPELERGIILNISPNAPEPGEEAVATLDHTSLSLDSARSITWFKDGEVARSQLGLDQLRFVTDPNGDTTYIQVNITLRDGRVIHATETISPAQVILTVHPDTYTPVFYQGRARYTPLSNITILAHTHTLTQATGYRTNQLHYTWKRNGLVLAEHSGVGKRSITLGSGLIQRPYTVSVDVTTPNNGAIIQDSVVLEPQEPQTHIYQVDPLAGIMNNRSAENTFQLTNTEATFRVEPYFFSLDTGIPSLDLDISWFLNGENKNISSTDITLRNTENNSKKAQLRVNVTNPNRFLQEAQTDINMIYTNSNN